MSKVDVVAGDSIVHVESEFSSLAKALLEWGVDLIDIFSEPEIPETFTIVLRSSDCALSMMEGVLLGNKVLALDLVGDDDMITTTQVAYDAPIGFSSFTFVDFPMDRMNPIVDAIRMAIHIDESGLSDFGSDPGTRFSN